MKRKRQKLRILGEKERNGEKEMKKMMLKGRRNVQDSKENRVCNKEI